MGITHRLIYIGETMEMGLFSARFTKEGPGVRKDEPKKKGLARFFEVLFRDYGNIVKVNFLFLLCCIPMTLTLLFGYLFHQYLGMLLIAVVLYLLSCLLLGMGMTSMHGILVKVVRDEPFYMWHEFKRYWKDNWKQSMSAGVLFGTALALECVAAWYYLRVQSNLRVVFLAVVMFSFFALVVSWTFTCLQMLFLDMKLGVMVKNSLLILCGYIKRTLPAGLLMILIFGGVFLYTPVPFLPIVLLLGLPAITALVGDLWAWPVMEELFQITQRQAEKKGTTESQNP